MVHFRTKIHLYRYFTDSNITLNFCSLLSAEFLTFDLMSKFPDWEIAAVLYYAQFEGERFSWLGSGAPRDFTGHWIFMYNTVHELAKDTL